MSDSGTVVELRVHGVSGTPPEALLSCPTEFLTQEAGDKSAGFYRRQPWIDDAQDAVADRQATWRRVMEAYSWGGLTSGPASRAVWLLFLPFIFVNLAHWMLPPATKGRRSAAISVALLRLVALSFTLTLMLAAAVAVMDVMVWQCVGLDYCAAQWGPLSALASISRGPQVALSAVPLVVVIVVLWRLGKESTRVVGRPPNPAVMADEVPLESDTFWCADPSVVRLRACHVMAWTAGLAALTVAAPLSYAVSALGMALLVANARDPGGRCGDDRLEPGDGTRWYRRGLADATTAAAALDLGRTARRVVGVGGRCPRRLSACANTFPRAARDDLRAAGCAGGSAGRLVRVHRTVDARTAEGRRRRVAADAGRVHRSLRRVDRLADRRRVQRRCRAVDRAGTRERGGVHRRRAGARSSAGQRHSATKARRSRAGCAN